MQATKNKGVIWRKGCLIFIYRVILEVSWDTYEANRGSRNVLGGSYIGSQAKGYVVYMLHVKKPCCLQFPWTAPRFQRDNLPTSNRTNLHIKYL